jgi:hypothetical protein
MPSLWTFDLKPVKRLLKRYIYNAKSVLVPFAGKYRFDRNGVDYIDIMPDLPKPYIQGDCVDVMKDMAEKGNKYDLAVVDPPYTCFQAVRSYGNEKLQDITVIRNTIDKILKDDAITIFFGYNSTGMGNKRGYKKLEILLVNLGGSHNDIIVTVEQKGNPKKNYFHGMEGLK